MRILALTVASFATTLLVSGCAHEDPAAGGSSVGGGREDAEAVRYLHESVGGSGDGGADATGPGYEATRLRDLLCNVYYPFQAGDQPTTDALLLGDVSAVEEGAAYLDIGRDGKETVFDNPEALWRVFFVTFEVEREIAPCSEVNHYSPGDLVEIQMSIGATPDFARVRHGLLSQGRSVYFLQAPGKGEMEPQTTKHPLYRVMRFQSLIIEVDEDGTLSLPFMGDDGESMLGTIETLSDLETESAEPVVVRDSMYAGPKLHCPPADSQPQARQDCLRTLRRAGVDVPRN